MEVKLFYKTQRELAIAVNNVIDAYWADEINEKDLMGNIKNLYINNGTKMLKDRDFTTVLRQQCGKRRLEIVSHILSLKQEGQV